MQIFSSVLRKYFNNTSADVSLLLARAFYDADQMPQAKRALLRAVHLDPTDLKLRFNVALVLQVAIIACLKSSWGWLQTSRVVMHFKEIWPG